MREPLNVFDYEMLAASKLSDGAYAFYAGGANDELTLRENVEGYRRWHLRPRVLCDVADATADAVTVDALARVRLAATRHGCQTRVHGASRELIALLDFVGLRDLAPV